MKLKLDATVYRKLLLGSVCGAGVLACFASQELAEQKISEQVSSTLQVAAATHAEVRDQPGPGIQSEEGRKPAPPPTQKILVSVKGVQEVREANLFESALGYYMYVLPDFVASGEEPGQDILFSKVDDRFSARIEKMGTSIDQEKLRQRAEKELSDIGQVMDRKASSMARDPFWKQAAFYLSASNKQTIKDIFVFQEEGVWFKVTRFLVNTEALEGMEPSLLAMIKTIRVK